MPIDDTFAEAFDMRATALVITAPTARWARQAAVTMTGFATSVIGCGCEAGIDATLVRRQTPDGRPGVRVLLFAGSDRGVAEATARPRGAMRADQPRLRLLRRAGRGRKRSSSATRCAISAMAGRSPSASAAATIWRIPVMDGEFVCEGTTGLTKDAVGGGNLILMGRTAEATLAAAEAAADAIAGVADAIAPFPGGIARSGSKVGSKYKALPASTNDAYCPTLRGVARQSALGEDTQAVLEIVIDGLTPEAVAAAMRAGLLAAIALGPERGASRIGAGNYGGKLGKHHFHLVELLS